MGVALKGWGFIWGSWQGQGGRLGALPHLQNYVTKVVQEQHQRTNTQQIAAVGEEDQDDGDEVMDHLLLEVLREMLYQCQIIDSQREGRARTISTDKLWQTEWL